MAEEGIPCIMLEGMPQLDHPDDRTLDSGKRRFPVPVVILDQMPETHKIGIGVVQE